MGIIRVVSTKYISAILKNIFCHEIQRNKYNNAYIYIYIFKYIYIYIMYMYKFKYQNEKNDIQQKDMGNINNMDSVYNIKNRK